MKLKCGFCNEDFEVEDMYTATKEYYKNYPNFQVKEVGFSRKGNVKVPHLYICPLCKHLVNNASLSVAEKGNGTLS